MTQEKQKKLGNMWFQFIKIIIPINFFYAGIELLNIPISRNYEYASIIIVNFIILMMAMMGLYIKKFKKLGYYSLMAVFTSIILFNGGIAVVTLIKLRGFYPEVLGQIFASLIYGIPNLIYFYKRRNWFDCGTNRIVNPNDWEQSTSMKKEIISEKKLDITELPTVDFKEDEKVKSQTNLISSGNEYDCKGIIYFCKKCGAPHDKVATKCVNCGARLRLIPSIKKLGISTCVLSLLVIALIIFCGILGKSLLTTKESLQNETDALKYMLTTKEDKVYSITKQYDDLKRSYKDLKDIYNYVYDKATFLDNHIAFIVDNDKKYYHTYDCSKFKNCKSFLAYNVENAQSLGYEQDPDCRFLPIFGHNNN